MQLSLIRRSALALAIAATTLTAHPLLAQDKAGDKAEAAATKPAGAEVPVKVVVLFSSGVGYFEHIGPVKGDTSAELRFKTQQINDILKSLVLQDTGGGRVSTIVYPSQDPIAKTLKSFQIDITGNPSLAELLNQLRGAKVTVAAQDQKLAGTILGVEKKPKATEKGHIEVWQLNLLSDGGAIRTIMMDDVSSIELQDPQLQEEMTKALSALSQARDQDKKPVTINFEGRGERTVRIGYVVETPIWKTSYRLLIGEERSGLQGWAIIENQTDNDWSNVQLSLVSGRPISFIQELYQPLYIPRPVVNPELFASLRPQTYDAGMKDRELQEEARMESAARARGGAVLRRQERLAAPAAAGAMADSAAMAETLAKSIDPSESVSSVAQAAQVGELFQYSVGNVWLPRQRSAMIPIITDPIEVEKLSIYNQSVLQKHPLNGARLKNTTNKHLLQGPITVLEAGTYAGDARIDNLPPGQERLLSYGVDLQMLVNATKNRQENSILSGRIVKGVLHIQRKHVFTQEYVAENKREDRATTLIVEHPLRQGWKLVQPEKPLETTDALYRFRVEVPAGKSEGLTVQEQLVQAETIQILPLDFGTLVHYSRTGEIPKDVRDALAKAATMKQAMEEYQRQVRERQQEINRITQEQQRIRENIKTVNDRTALHKRLVEKLTEQENQIDDLYQRMDEAQKNFEKQRKELENYVANLNIG
jgi:hypothetical protein